MVLIVIFDSAFLQNYFYKKLHLRLGQVLNIPLVSTVAPNMHQRVIYSIEINSWEIQLNVRFHIASELKMHLHWRIKDPS